MSWTTVWNNDTDLCDNLLVIFIFVDFLYGYKLVLFEIIFGF